MCEGTVTIVAVITVDATCHEDVYKSVVVEICHFGLQRETVKIQSRSLRDVREESITVVLQQRHGGRMICQKAVEIAVVVAVRKVHSPALLIQHQPAFLCYFSPSAVSVVHPDLVDATRIERIIDELAAFRNHQVYIAIVVKITEHRAVIATMVGVGVVRIIVVCQIDQRCIDVQIASVAFPHARKRIVVAPKRVQLTVVIDVGKTACLHKHRAIGKVHITR